MTFVTKDSGERQLFSTGAQRDTQSGKPQFDRIPVWLLALLQFPFSRTWLHIDRTAPPITGLCPEDEVRRDLLPDEFLNRLGGLLHRGALKYDDNNWRKGIYLSRIFASALRHSFLWLVGDTSEDHATAAAWNWMAIIVTEIDVTNGVLPKDLADAGPLKDK